MQFLMNLKSFKVSEYITTQGALYLDLELSYQVFGRALGEVPVVLINHALTGNSDVASDEKGWWKTIVGNHKTINLQHYTVIGIDVLGNGYSNSEPKVDLRPKDFTIRDIAKLNWDLLKSLSVTNLYACIGGSVGGGIAWEMAFQNPKHIQYLIPIASHWKATDWIIGHNYVQNEILKQENGLELARMMAMMFYRTPDSFENKFNGERSSEYDFKVNSWLNYHGESLKDRYATSSYCMMNHLLATLNVEEDRGCFSNIAERLACEVIQIGIASDLYFSSSANVKTKKTLDLIGLRNTYHNLDSIHGHDAFLIEYDQLQNILAPYFNPLKTNL